jgi:glycosyltransferase involved in cell wall biosynthesis
VAITLCRVTQGLQALGYDIELIRPYDRHSKSTTPGLEGMVQHLVRGLPIPGYQAFQMGLPAYGRLKATWQENRPDIVHIATEGPLGWSALRAAKALNIPVSTDYRTNFGAYTKHYGLGFLEYLIESYLRRFHNRAHATTVPTRALARQLERLGFERLHVVGRGIDSTRFNPSLRDDGLRASWSVGEEDVVLAYVGRLAAEKNLDLLISAYRSQVTSSPRARLLIVGDGPMRQALTQQIPNAIIVGQKGDTDLARHYASADAFLFPSLTETYGNVVPEAMASGLPVLAFDCAAASELIEHGISGLLAPVASPQEFIELATVLASDASLRRSLGCVAREVAINNGWEQIIRRFSDLLAQTAAQARTPIGSDRTRG